MSHELHDALRDAVGSPEDRPGLDGLWARGRGRRRRKRLATGAVAIVAVVGLAVGAIALAGGDDGAEDVVAGPSSPTGRDVVDPPDEPTDLAITMTITAGEDRDGVSVVDPGGTFTVTFGGADGYRSVGIAWEAWDGRSWTLQHDLLPGDPASVLAPGETDVYSSTRDLDDEPLPLIVPDAPAGWYRVCSAAWAETGPPAAGEHAPPVESVRPCAQLRILPDEPVATTSAPDATTPPPAEPELPVTIGLGPEHPPGTLLFVDIVWADGATGTRARDATWEAWDGTTWTATHQTTVTGFDDVPEIHPDDQRVPVEPTMVPAEGRVALLTPPATEAPPGTYRLCLAVAVTGADEADLLCEQTTLTEADLVVGYPDREAATWETDPTDPPGPDDQVISVLVTRVRCTDGEAGRLLDPEVRASDDAVSITFSSGPGDDDCPADEPVRREVDLGAPLGDRGLLDGICGGQEQGLIPACDEGFLRWPER